MVCRLKVVDRFAQQLYINNLISRPLRSMPPNTLPRNMTLKLNVRG